MLKAAGIESWPVSIFSGDPLFVRAEWPTPQQFNHCILAILAPAGYAADAVIDDPGLIVPHPRFRERRFVLEPLLEIAPELRDPVTSLTVAELLQRRGGPAG